MKDVPWVNTYRLPEIVAARKLFRETNDCTVISFTQVWDTTYDLAHKHLKKQFRRPNRGGPSWANCHKAVELCPKTKITDMGYTRDNKITINQFIERHPKGRYWVFVSGHALAIIDGVLYDHSYKLKRRVILAFKVEL